MVDLLHQLGCPFCIAYRADYSLVDTVYSHMGASALYYRAAGETKSRYRDAFDGQWPSRHPIYRLMLESLSMGINV